MTSAMTHLDYIMSDKTYVVFAVMELGASSVVVGKDIRKIYAQNIQYCINCPNYYSKKDQGTVKE